MQEMIEKIEKKVLPIGLLVLVGSLGAGKSTFGPPPFRPLAWAGKGSWGYSMRHSMPARPNPATGGSGASTWTNSRRAVAQLDTRWTRAAFGWRAG
jgi:hypothetical protein